MSLALEGRLALVTGASRGIGRATALELARGGAHVVALARTQGALEELDDDIRQLGGEATLVPCDIKDSDALDRLGAALHERWGRLDILVANAGVLGPITPIGHVDPKQWDNVLAVNVTANYRLIRLARSAAPGFRSRPCGVRVVGCRPSRRDAALLGPLRDFESGARRHGAGLTRPRPPRPPTSWSPWSTPGR